MNTFCIRHCYLPTQYFFFSFLVTKVFYFAQRGGAAIFSLCFHNHKQLCNYLLCMCLPLKMRECFFRVKEEVLSHTLYSSSSLLAISKLLSIIILPFIQEHIIGVLAFHHLCQHSCQQTFFLFQCNG